MYQDDVQTLVRLLLYATAQSRRQLAERILNEKDGDAWALLATTVRSRDDPVLRARCLEVLGLVAAAAEPHEAELILSALFD